MFSRMGKYSRLVFCPSSKTILYTARICQIPPNPHREKKKVSFCCQELRGSEIKPNKVNCWLKSLAGPWGRSLSVGQGPVSCLRSRSWSYPVKELFLLCMCCMRFSALLLHTEPVCHSPKTAMSFSETFLLQS